VVVPQFKGDRAVGVGVAQFVICQFELREFWGLGVHLRSGYIYEKFFFVVFTLLLFVEFQIGTDFASEPTSNIFYFYSSDVKYCISVALLMFVHSQDNLPCWLLFVFQVED
jgi:hypothetical protein